MSSIDKMTSTSTNDKSDDISSVLTSPTLPTDNNGGKSTTDGELFVQHTFVLQIFSV